MDEPERAPSRVLTPRADAPHPRRESKVRARATLGVGLGLGQGRFEPHSRPTCTPTRTPTPDLPLPLPLTKVHRVDEEMFSQGVVETEAATKAHHPYPYP